MRARLIALLLLASPAALAAQATGTISPNMSQKQVVAALGAPATARTVGEHTYLFYRNNCGKACGMNDLVVLRRDSVVDAIFRSASRHYTGRSSSPAPLSGTSAKKTAAAPERTTAPEKKSTTLAPPPATDTRPSIPVTTQPVRPAPSTSPKKPAS